MKEFSLLSFPFKYACFELSKKQVDAKLIARADFSADFVKKIQNIVFCKLYALNFTKISGDF